MGTNVAPTYANLFLVFHELLWRKKGTWFPYYFRFLDDVFFMSKKDDALRNASLMNDQTKSLSFTFEFGPNDSTFLDLKLRKNKRWERNRVLDVEFYEKPTNKHLYTDPFGDYPTHYRFSWIRGEAIRHLRNNSDRESYVKSTTEFVKHLEQRGYPPEVANRGKSIDFSHRAILMHTTRKKDPSAHVVCTPHRKGHELLKKHFGILNKLFTSPDDRMRLPRYTFVVKKGHKIIDYLNSLRKTSTSGNTNSDPGRRATHESRDEAILAVTRNSHRVGRVPRDVAWLPP